MVKEKGLDDVKWRAVWMKENGGLVVVYIQYKKRDNYDFLSLLIHVYLCQRKGSR